MTPLQFLDRMRKKQLAPAFLFLGPDAYERGRCRQALLDAVVGPDNRENAITRYDLADTALATLVDDARSFSLFATDRVIVGFSAESVLPRRMEDDEETGGGSPASAASLSAYLANPTPGVTLLLEATRFEFEGDDKRKLDRVRKFYAAIHDVVELRRAPAEDARGETEAIARRAGLRLPAEALGLLVEALGADLARIQVEIEKLATYAGPNGAVTVEDIAALVPDARSTTIFAFVDALGRRHRARSLQTLDTLVKEGEYLPLALAFLAGLFRMALVAREANLRSPQQILSHFSSTGAPMWFSRAEQVHQTLTRFSKEQLEKAVEMVFAVDRDLRSPRPDDRTVMERFVFELTA
jgi:DNA polymerase-3 subunit delta